jgi:hypothetical protein
MKKLDNMILKKCKPKKCQICGTEFKPMSSLHVVCTFGCSIKMLDQKNERKRLADERKDRLETRKALDRIKTKAQWMKEVQQAFNKWIRKRDEEQPCISCGRHHQGQYHAGHYRTTKAAPELRFNEFNVNKQCRPCNEFLSGNIVDYRKGLAAKYGLMVVEYLEGPHEPKKYTIDDLKAIKAEYTKRLKDENTGSV